MIEEPPLLKVKAIRPKPDLMKIEALRGVPTGILADALNGRGALHHSIKPLSPTVLPADLCGPALTCLCGPADILAILGSLHEITKGEILVIATDNWTGCAATGDRVIGMLKNAGGAIHRSACLLRGCIAQLSVCQRTWRDRVYRADGWCQYFKWRYFSG